jgi:hypothetical protein
LCVQPDARAASKGCEVVPKKFQNDSFLAPQAVAERQRSDRGFSEFSKYLLEQAFLRCSTFAGSLTSSA